MGIAFYGQKVLLCDPAVRRRIADSVVSVLFKTALENTGRSAFAQRVLRGGV
jgi:hypothetical protein